MCGILGFNWHDKKKLKKSLDIIRHRGPDDEGDYFDQQISLGHRRLSIIDLSTKGHQPMQLLKRYQIIFNGEIYNYKEIKKELRGYSFNSNSDTEVLGYAYDKWGKDCLNKFNGMFSFCIYDMQKNELFLAKDRFGKKPLYYIHDRERFIFGSEIKSLTPFLDKVEVDEKSLSQFFTFRFTLKERTLIKRILKFLPGHYMRFDLKNNSVIEYEKYYELKKQEIVTDSFKVNKENVKKLIEQSVKRRMVSDVPVACFLSGGIDSSIIAMIAKKYNKKLNTFSIGFDTTNELPYAKIVANHLKTNHYEFKIEKDEIEKYLDLMVYHMDEPIGDPGFLPIFVLSSEVRKYNKVVLSGDGADEIFCGYDRYKLFRYADKISKVIPHHFNNDILKRIHKSHNKTDYNAFFEIIRLFDNDELKKLKIPKFNASELWENKYAEKVKNAMDFDIKTLLPEDFFMKSDKMSSAFGLEQRTPFMDYELVEYAFSIPLKHKLGFWNEKKILKEAFKDDLPKEISKRRKHGFNVPIDYWFKNVLGDRLRSLLKSNNHKLYNKIYVEELLDKIRDSGTNYKMNFILAQKLWSILMFEMWYEIYIKK